MRADRLAHLVRVEVLVADRPCRFLVDTGIGVNIVSTVLVADLGLVGIGESFTGRRMSGQSIQTPLVLLPPLTIDGTTIGDQVAGIADLGPAEGPEGFAGILGLTTFAGTSFTLDPVMESLSVGSAPDDVDVVAPLDLKVDGPSLTPYLELLLPNGRQITVELDTGSSSLILNDSLRSELRLLGEVEERVGVDETGHSWIRRFATLDGSIEIAGAAATAQEHPRVMFQEIIHDGLLGTDFLERYRYTVDVAGCRLLLDTSP